MTTDLHITEVERYEVGTYTLEEIDDNLATLSNLLTYSHKCNKDDVKGQLDKWLDRRLDEVEARR